MIIQPIIVRLSDIASFLKMELGQYVDHFILDTMSYTAILEFELDVYFHGQIFRRTMGDYTASVLDDFSIPCEVKGNLLSEIIERVYDTMNLALGYKMPEVVYKVVSVNEDTFIIHNLGDWRIMEYNKMIREQNEIGLEHGDGYERLVNNSNHRTVSQGI